MNSRLVRSKKKYAVAIALTLSLATLSACGGNDKPVNAPTETALETSTPSATPTPTPTPTPVSTLTAPLTGLPVDKEITNRPFAVMINNFAAARPQSGLTNADTVWEIEAEGGITRLVAIFQSKEFTDPIGPVRSIRPYFIQVGEFYNSVIAHVGASNDALAIIQRQKKQTLDEINNSGASFYRDKSRKAPHNVYTTLEMLREGTAKRKYPETANVPVLTFDPAPPALTTAASATQIKIKFAVEDYKVSYTYDPASSLYNRFINEKPHIDKNNDKQLTAKNLVVLATKIQTYDSYGRLVVDLDSGGDAVVFQQGKVIEAKWERKEGDVIRIMKDGKELPFLPGVTYYHVVPKAKELSFYLTYQ